ncbi:MAG: hypothetical protein CMI94_01255 [Pelagibacteraceae bacterium]|nr:hypothetical protein [Pelagibacteraceae bacterium]
MLINLSLALPKIFFANFKNIFLYLINKYLIENIYIIPNYKIYKILYNFLNMNKFFIKNEKKT